MTVNEAYTSLDARQLQIVYSLPFQNPYCYACHKFKHKFERNKNSHKKDNYSGYAEVVTCSKKCEEYLKLLLC